MRTLLIGLAIIQAVVIGQEDHFNKAVTLGNVNKKRAGFAELFKVANMNELAYDKSLEKFAKLELAKYISCPLPNVITVGNIEMLPNGDFELYKELLADPGRTRLAVIKNPCKSDRPTELQVFISDLNDNVLMLNGEPGSRCPGSRPFVNNGLCGVRRH